MTQVNVTSPTPATVTVTSATSATVTSTTGGPQGARGPVGTTPVFQRAGQLVALTGTSRFYVEDIATVSVVRASVGAAPIGAPVIVDVNRNGVSIFTNQAERPTIAAGSYTDTATPTVTALAAGDYLTVDIDGVGSTTPGADLTVTVTLA